jgi:hypothetical protein
MCEELGGWVGLEDFFIGATTNARDSNRVDEQVFNPDVIDKDLEDTFLSFGLIDDHDVKRH